MSDSNSELSEEEFDFDEEEDESLSSEEEPSHDEEDEDDNEEQKQERHSSSSSSSSSRSRSSSRVINREEKEEEEETSEQRARRLRRPISPAAAIALESTLVEMISQNNVERNNQEEKKEESKSNTENTRSSNDDKASKVGDDLKVTLIARPSTTINVGESLSVEWSTERKKGWLALYSSALPPDELQNHQPLFWCYAYHSIDVKDGSPNRFGVVYFDSEWSPIIPPAVLQSNATNVGKEDELLPIHPCQPCPLRPGEYQLIYVASSHVRAPYKDVDVYHPKYEISASINIIVTKNPLINTKPSLQIINNSNNKPLYGGCSVSLKYNSPYGLNSDWIALHRAEVIDISNENSKLTKHNAIWFDYVGNNKTGVMDISKTGGSYSYAQNSEQLVEFLKKPATLLTDGTYVWSYISGIQTKKIIENNDEYNPNMITEIITQSNMFTVLPYSSLQTIHPLQLQSYFLDHNHPSSIQPTLIQHHHPLPSSMVALLWQLDLIYPLPESLYVIQPASIQSQTYFNNPRAPLYSLMTNNESSSVIEANKIYPEIDKPIAEDPNIIQICKLIQEETIRNALFNVKYVEKKYQVHTYENQFLHALNHQYALKKKHPTSLFDLISSYMYFIHPPFFISKTYGTSISNTHYEEDNEYNTGCYMNFWNTNIINLIIGGWRIQRIKIHYESNNQCIQCIQIGYAAPEERYVDKNDTSSSSSAAPINKLYRRRSLTSSTSSTVTSSPTDNHNNSAHPFGLNEEKRTAASEKSSSSLQDSNLAPSSSSSSSSPDNALLNNGVTYWTPLQYATKFGWTPVLSVPEDEQGNKRNINCMEFVLEDHEYINEICMNSSSTLGINAIQFKTNSSRLFTYGNIDDSTCLTILAPHHTALVGLQIQQRVNGVRNMGFVFGSVMKNREISRTEMECLEKQEGKHSKINHTASSSSSSLTNKLKEMNKPTAVSSTSDKAKSSTAASSSSSSSSSAAAKSITSSSSSTSMSSSTSSSSSSTVSRTAASISSSSSASTTSTSASSTSPTSSTTVSSSSSSSSTSSSSSSSSTTASASRFTSSSIAGMANAAEGESVILEEEFDPDYEPTEAEIREYAQFLGMDLIADRELFWIAREGLKAPLPDPWKPCKTPENEVYYFNFETGESTWEHPCDEYYKAFYQREKEKLRNRQTNG